MTVWVTGFEAFGRLEQNPTALLLEALAAAPPVPELQTMLLPVTYRECEPLLEQVLETRPRLVVALGAHAGATCFELERIGVNLDETERPDNAIEVRREQPIRPGRPDAHRSTLPLPGLRDALCEAGVPAVISNSAGSYLCNHVLYTLLDRIAELRLPTRAGFFHLPLFPEQAARESPPVASMARELQLRGLAVALDYCLGGCFEESDGRNTDFTDSTDEQRHLWNL